MPDDFVIERDCLLAALKMMERLASKTSIQIETQPDRFVLRSLSIETGAVSLSCPGRMVTGKRIAPVVPFKVLFDLVRAANATEFHLNTDKDEKKLTLVGGDQRVSLKVSSEEFPEIVFATQEMITLPADRLRKALESVVWCCAKENSGRPGLEGVHLEWKNQTLTFVAADGFRLSYTIWTIPSAETREMTIPVRSVQFLIGVIKDFHPQEIRVGMTERGFLCEMETAQELNFQAFFPQIDQRFPDWRTVMKQANSENATLLQIASSELQDAVKRAVIFAREDHSIPLCLKVTPSILEVYGEDTSLGHCQTLVPLQNPTGFEETLWFNGRFFLDMLEEEGQNNQFNLSVQNRKIPVCSGWELEGLKNGCLLMPLLKEA